MRQIVLKTRAWLALARLPFHLVGVLPFVLGTLLAWRNGSHLHGVIFTLGALGVIAVMLTAYFSGEYWDYREDSLARGSRFSGGSQVIQRGLLPRVAALRAAVASLALAGVIGIVLQFVYRTGPWTIPFGAIGLLGAFFYSAKPLRWVSRGWGELWIAFCYGWLPVAVGYYLQTGRLIPLINWMAVPIGLTIFNVILLNEFLDYEADIAAGKRNLGVRLGRRRAAVRYAFIAVVSWLAMFVSLTQDVPLLALWSYLPFFLISLGLVILILKGKWQDRSMLEKMCAANLVVNLGTTLAYITGILGSGSG